MSSRDDIPEGRLARSLVGGKTVARVGGVYLRYAASKRFRSEAGREAARREMSGKGARILLDGLCQLRGTALKMAQMLSLELDMFPPEVRSQLERSCNEVPPMNRAVARKVLVNAYGISPEKMFTSFDSTAFAAASLGQVHKALSAHGEKLALKIQYPGIRGTIHNDVRILKGLLRPFPEYGALAPAIGEIEARFLEETDYLREAENMEFFRNSLNMKGVFISEVFPELCTEQVLCVSLLEGQPLNSWLKTGPDSRSRDMVAQRLQDIFIRSLYELQCIHADPNPGNFLVFPNLEIGVVDFGCVKRFSPSFVDRFRRLALALNRNDRQACVALLGELGTIEEDADPAQVQRIGEAFATYGEWISRLYADGVFDFGTERDFMREGKELSMSMRSVLRELNINPDFVFLDRTRYGLLRIFERMEARVRFRNPFEWPY